ncbi:hypothetical protein DsansV1_C19g0158781 [Dioscorea sansibarensis]
MEHDGVIWLVVRHHLCIFKAKITTGIEGSLSLFTLQALFWGLISCKYCVFY